MPQVLKTWRSREVADLSVNTVIVLVIGLSLWLIYGTSIHSLSVIVSSVVSLLINLALLLLIVRLQKRQREFSDSSIHDE
ncbi:MAG: hypothetical protein H6765_07365 [Candidatus Peribacteria bacterium]|nr:MAG: hypothetical protein H6765_07365 [Candidatus Peribacteria bacterium]